MKGKESDVHLAIQLRASFIMQYNDDEAFGGLLNKLEKDHDDRLVHKLTKEIKMNIGKHYKDLKQIIATIRQQHAREVFIHICKMDDARTWVNDNGKYTDLVFEAVYALLKADTSVLKLLSE
ncbi:MAG: hypothetical protein K0S71_672 [Clostridia bacterium]|nr:hypothetical protein [Clostridia bacterium]